MKKENLIIVQPFAGNSRRLKGLIEFLKDYFNVYFIDLPGWSKNIEPLSHISLDNYSQYVEQKIKKLNLPEYWAGGISLGFEILDHANLGENCKGLFAVEPYLNSRSLRRSFKVKTLPIVLIGDLACFSKSYKRIWENRIFKKYLIKLSGLDKEEARKTLDEIDPKTFFETIRLLYKCNKNVTFHHLPCVLLVNKFDEILDYNYVLKVFKKNKEKELIIDDIRIPHVPQDLSKEYFKMVFPENDLKKILNFISRS